MIENSTYTGILKVDDKNSYLELENGKKVFVDETIWSGYLKHWNNKKVNARQLKQRDYENDEPIIIVWPFEDKIKNSYVRIYYNERLVKYWQSTLGHLAININGKIFNFAEKYNEIEIITKEEYFYRPALGEFAPSPITGRQEIFQEGKSYLDKFGRNFMRGIHVCHIEGINTDKLYNVLSDKMNMIHNTPPNPKDPENWPDFHFIKSSCTSIVRDGLRECGFPQLKGVIPRDFFVNASYNFQKEKNLRVKLYKKPQLFVREAPPSKQTPLFNIINRIRNLRLKFDN